MTLLLFSLYLRHPKLIWCSSLDCWLGSSLHLMFRGVRLESCLSHCVDMPWGWELERNSMKLNQPGLKACGAQTLKSLLHISLHTALVCLFAIYISWGRATICFLERYKYTFIPNIIVTLSPYLQTQSLPIFVHKTAALDQMKHTFRKELFSASHISHNSTAGFQGREVKGRGERHHFT